MTGEKRKRAYERKRVFLSYLNTIDFFEIYFQKIVV